jgi:putative SOS response-associated peptidase YedK
MTTKIKDTPPKMQIIVRLNALKRAEKAAKNPEFKKLWKEKRIALIAKDVETLRC